MSQSDNQGDATNPAKDADSAKTPPTRKPPLEAILIPVGKSNAFRPPPANTIGLTPKPSAAPPPVMRPAMPAPTMNIGPATGSSAAQELASAVSRGRWQDEYISIPRTGAAGDPLHLRRTLIPVLLTFSVILAAAGALLLMDFQDNALADLFPKWAPIALLVLSGLTLAIAALNIISVRNALRRSEKTLNPKPPQSGG